MNIFKLMHRALYPHVKRHRPVPRQMINAYQRHEIDSDAVVLLMLNGAARSPDAARELLAKYETDSVAEVLRQLPKKKGKTLWQRFVTIMARLDQKHEGDPYRHDKHFQDKL